MIPIRALEESELATLLEWAAQEGWNPGDERDAFWATDPQAYLGMHDDGELVAGLAIVDYGGRLGNMGLFIVRPDHRGRGLGRRLWYEGRDRLLERLDPGAPIAIDAVKAMEDFYADSGFRTVHDQHRMLVRSRREECPSAVRRIRGPLGSVPDLDTRCFGAPRPLFLAAWLGQADHMAFAHVEERLRGFGVLRPCRTGYKVGPLFADSADVADGLFRAMAAEVPMGSEIFVDVPGVNVAGMDWVAGRGGTEVFTCARMYYGAPPTVDWSSVYGVTTLELG
jgi:GNAT superfamily N-acetyltransferase